MKNATCLVQWHPSECRPVGGLADIPENSCSLGVRARDTPAVQAERSENEWTFRIVGNFGANVLDAPFPF